MKVAIGVLKTIISIARNETQGFQRWAADGDLFCPVNKLKPQLLDAFAGTRDPLAQPLVYGDIFQLQALEVTQHKQ